MNSTTGAPMCRVLLPVTPAAPPAAAGEVRVDLAPLCGTYVADEGQVLLDEVDGRLRVTHEVDAAFGDVMRLILGPVGFPPPPFVATPVAADVFQGENGMSVQFVGQDAAGVPTHVDVGRIYRRIG